MEIVEEIKTIEDKIEELGNIIEDVNAENDYSYDMYSWDEGYIDAVSEIRALKNKVIELKNSQREKVFCPICNWTFLGSDHLRTVFSNENTRWLANMVTHYRHSHITSWNKCWDRYGGQYRGNWFGDYDEEKRKVNERAKRQIMRKAKEYLKDKGITVEHFCSLQNTDEKTIALAKKLLKTSKINDFNENNKLSNSMNQIEKQMQEL